MYFIWDLGSRGMRRHNPKSSLVICKRHAQFCDYRVLLKA